MTVELVDLLIAAGADVNGRRKDASPRFRAPLTGVIRQSPFAVIETLLRHGADPEIRGCEGGGPHAGRTAADLALAQGQIAAAARLGG